MIPTLRVLVKKAKVNFVALQPSDLLREEPFVLPYVLAFISLPDCTKWCPPNNVAVLVGIVNVARAWKLDFLMNYLSSTLEMPLDVMYHGKNMRQRIRSKLRWVLVHIHTVTLTSYTLFV